MSNSNAQQIKQELLSAIKIELDSELKKKIESELDILDVTEGLNDKNNLESFYEIWQKHKDGPPGHENKVNSWLAHALGLTTVKPNGDFLPARRAFARAGFPDIDSDFDYFRRQEVYDFIINKFGREYVGNIGTYGTLKLKATIRRLGKALDVADAWHKEKNQKGAFTTENEAMVTEIVKSLPKQQGAILKVKDEDGNEKVIKTVEDAYKYCPDFKFYVDKFPDLRKHAKDIEGLMSNYSVHAAGIVISNTPLHSIAPMRVCKKGQATQFAYEDLESIGLIKFDILALSTLTVINEAVKLVKSNYGIDINVKALPLKDDKTYELYRSGRLTGVFQCENGGMQDCIQKLETNSFEDIMVAIALYRPGPMENIAEYALRKKGLSDVDYFHPSIEKYVKPILQKTYGFPVYQEQIMQICNAVANFSITDGYVLIKGIGKKKDYLIEKFRKQFIEGSGKNGVPTAVAEEYWKTFITRFAGYGFNAAHSCCYAYLSYMTAYLKANYPDEFFTAYLNVENIRKKHEKIVDLERDLKHFDIVLLPRKINNCDENYKIVKKKDVSSGIMQTEIMPSIMCKGMGIESAIELARLRPFTGLRDIAFRVNSKTVNTDTIGCLVDGGFFDDEFKEFNKKLEKGKKVKKDQFKELILQKYNSLKEDAKAAAQKGIGTESLFD